MHTHLRACMWLRDVRLPHRHTCSSATNSAIFKLFCFCTSIWARSLLTCDAPASRKGVAQRVPAFDNIAGCDDVLRYASRSVRVYTYLFVTTFVCLSPCLLCLRFAHSRPHRSTDGGCGRESRDDACHDIIMTVVLYYPHSLAPPWEARERTTASTELLRTRVLCTGTAPHGALTVCAY